MDFTTYAYIYNVADLQKWGVKPPTTLGQALAYCAAAKAHGGVGFAIAGAVPANTGVYAMLLARPTCTPRAQLGFAARPPGR